jgi:flagellar hook protein FlgE
MGILNVFSTSSAGMNVQATALQNISGNIANSRTPGYKKIDTNFSDMIPDSGIASQAAGSVGSSATMSTTLNGTITASDKPTDMALSGSGYFVVSKNTGSSTSPSFNDGNLYTRRGDFSRDVNGYLTNSAGYSLVGTSYAADGTASGSATSPIKLATTGANGASLSSVQVGSDGAITGSYDDGSTAKVGQIAIAQFQGDDLVQNQDGSAFAQTAQSGGPSFVDTGTTIVGGALEASNTDISDQFSKMIMTQQAYSSNSKVLSSANEMLEDAINILR